MSVGRWCDVVNGEAACCAVLVSSLEFLGGNWFLICGEFDQTAFGDVIGADTNSIYMAQEKRQRALCECLQGCGGTGAAFTPEAAGSSPVDLHGEADHWPDVFQPLDGKPQTDSQLGSEEEEEEGRNARTCDGTKRTGEKTRHICESKATSCSNCAVVKPM